MTGTASIIRADAAALPLADNCVDLIVTSPPYYGLRSYQDGGEQYAGQLGAETTPAAFIDSLIECTREMVRVLKPTGSIFVNLGDRYVAKPAGDGSSGRRDRSGSGSIVDTRRVGRERSLMLLPERYRIACTDLLGLFARAVVVWFKPNGMPEKATDRVRRAHEDWVHLTVRPHYFSDIDAIRERHSDHTLRYYGPGTSARVRPANATGNDVNKTKHRLTTVSPLGRMPTSVWEIATDPLRVPPHLGVDHFAAFPIEWPRRLILGWSPHGGVVLDPFGGTGTTALAAKALGRHGISIDMSADYCRLAEWRVNDPVELAKAMRVEKPPVELAGQSDLFEHLAGAAQ